MSVLALCAVLSLVVWAGIFLFRGGFWRADQRLSDASFHPSAWPEVVAVIPARNEADGIGLAVASLLAQDYAGRFSVVVVDDNSADDTAAAARRAAHGAKDADRLRIISGAPLAEGWTGKLWAVNQGLAEAERIAPAARYVLLTDADIVHARDTLGRLVAKAETEGRHLVSLMVKLRCVAFWETVLIPAFVFFFQKLYPFPWVNHPDCPVADAAGGCMLVRRDTLAAAGGIGAIRNRLIDDCALAALIKPSGSIWLGLAEKEISLRPYDRLDEVWNMVARTAFEQLHRSWAAVTGTVFGMVVLYIVPPLAALYGGATGDGFAALAGAGAWVLMAAAYRPTARLYGRPAWQALTLPLAGLLYTAMTVDSGLRHRRGVGGGWKGRSYS
ncbi:MAG: glycosyltransferase [Alphaproteobacteria bacterium]|nr:glycosyltransferase [Alphaproteobacteria bacterium]